MSNRTNYYRYGGSGGGGGAGIGGFGAVVPMLSSLLGKDKLSGGFQIGPDGKPVFIPYQGSTGFFGKQSQRDAEALNNQIMQAQYIQQLQREAALEAAKINKEAMLEAQRLQNTGLLDRTKLEGENEFYKQNQADITAKELQEAGNKAAIEKLNAEQIAEVLKAAGILATPKGATSYEETTLGQTLANLTNRGKVQELLGNLEIGALSDPASSKAFTTGRQQEMLKPLYENISRGTTQLPLNSAVLFPQLQEGSPLLDYTTKIGPTMEQIITPNPSGYGDPTVTQKVVPPLGTRVPLAPPPPPPPPPPQLPPTAPAGVTNAPAAKVTNTPAATLDEFKKKIKGQLTAEQLAEIMRLGLLYE